MVSFKNLQALQGQYAYQDGGLTFKFSESLNGDFVAVHSIGKSSLTISANQSSAAYDTGRANDELFRVGRGLLKARPRQVLSSPASSPVN
jgi:hypothetical protein